MRNVVLAVVGLVLTCGIANATVPDPELCAVTPCDTFDGVVTCPYDGVAPSATDFTVNVRNADNDPIPNAFVEIIFGTPGNHYLCPAVVLSGTTDTDGNVDFNVAAGGCTEGGAAIKIRANNVDIRTWMYVKSPDYDGSANGAVELTDFTFFGAALVASAPGCTDYYNDGATGLPDFTTFGECWGKSCN